MASATFLKQGFMDDLGTVDLVLHYIVAIEAK